MSFLSIKSTFISGGKNRPNFCAGLFYVFILLLCFDQLVVGNATLKWDAFRLWFPWKHFIVNELLNGDLPLWNPYHLSGFPQHGDSMTWYPVSWILGFITGGYNFLSLNLEYLLHLFIAGFGFYKLMRMIDTSWGCSILLGLSYMLSGFMLGNAQHLGWIVSAAWLPWIAVYLYRLVKEPNLKSASYFALVGFLFFSGGYLAIFFIALYLIAGFLIYILVKQPEKRLRIVTFGLVSLLMICLLSSPILLSVYDLSSVFDRAAPEAMGKAFDINYGGTPLNGIISIFFPFASGVYNVPEIEFGTFSTFFGTVPVILVLLRFKAIASKKHTLFLFFLALLLLLVSVGRPLPFRDFLGYFPLLNLFRYPTIFRLFSIFILLSLAGVVYQKIDNKAVKKFIENHTKHLFFLGGILFVLIVVIVVFFNHYGISLGDFLHSPSRYLSSINVYQRLVLSFFILLCGLFFFTLVIVIWKRKWKETLTILWVLELFIVANVATNSVVNEPVSVSYANERLDQQPYFFEELVQNYEKHEKKDWREFLGYAWQGKSILLKQPSANGFSPIKLKETSEMKNAKVVLPDSIGFMSRIRIEKGQIELLSLDARVVINGTSDWSIEPGIPLADDEYFVIKQRKTRGWRIETEDLSTYEFKTTKGGYMMIRSSNSEAIHLVYDKLPYSLAIGVFLVTVFVILVVIFLNTSQTWRWHQLWILAFIIVLIGYQNWERWFPKGFNDQPISMNNVSVNSIRQRISSESNEVYIPKNRPKTDYFLDVLNFYYNRKDLFYSNGLFRKYTTRNKRKPFITLSGKEFKEQGYLIEISQKLKEKIGNEPFYIYMSFKGLVNEDIKLWVNHSKNGKWLNGKAWNLKESVRIKGKSNFIRSIDMNNYFLEDGSQLKIYLSPTEEQANLQIDKFSLVPY